MIDDEAAGLPEYSELVVRAVGDRQGVVLLAQLLGGFTAAADSEPGSPGSRRIPERNDPQSRRAGLRLVGEHRASSTRGRISSSVQSRAKPTDSSP